MPDYIQSGNYNVKFTVSDGNLTDTKEAIINVANVTPEQLITETIDYIESLKLKKNTSKSITGILNNTSIKLANGNEAEAISQLNALINAISAQRYKKEISTETANSLIEKAKLILSLVNL